MVGIAPVRLTRRFSSSQMFSIIFKSGDSGGGVSRRHLRCLHSDMQLWPLSDGQERHRAAIAFLCGFSTMETPPYPALPVDSKLQLSYHL